MKHSLTSWTTVLLLIIATVLVNAIGNFFHVRFDVTEEKLFTLSDVTKSTLAELPDIVAVKVFFSEKLSPQFVRIADQVDDMLSEYEARSSGKISIRHVNTDSEDGRDEAQVLGIPEIEMQILEKDTLQVQKGFLGLAIVSLDKKEVIPVISQTNNLEYELSSAIKKVTSESVPTIGFITGHDEHGFGEFGAAKKDGQDYEVVKKALQKNYTVQSLSIDPSSGIHGIDTLVIAGGKEKWNDRDLYALDQFIISGGNAVFLMDAVTIGNDLSAQAIDIGMDDFLKHWGVTLQKNIVFDRYHESATFGNGFISFVQPYPFFVKIPNAAMDSANAIVSRVEGVSFPWASSLSLGVKEDVSRSDLLVTSGYAGSAQSPFDLDPSQSFAYASGDGSKTLASILQAKFTSFFDGKQIPPPSESKAEILDGIVFREKAEKESRLMFVGDSDFLSDLSIRDWPNNLVFFLNAVDSLTLDRGFMEIRAKSSTPVSLKVLDEREKNALRFFAIAAMPMAVMVFGIVKLWFRRKNNQLSL